MALRHLSPLLGLGGLLLLAAAPAAAQSGRGTDGLLTQVRTASQFEEAPQAGRLVGWTEDGPRLEKGQAPADWVRLSFPLAVGAPVSPAPEWVLELGDGLRLPGAPRAGSADRLDWAIGHGGDLVLLPVDLLVVRGFGRTRIPIPPEDQEEDLLVLRTPAGFDRRSGWLEEITPEGISFAVGDRVETHAWERVEGLRLLEEEMLYPVVQGQVLVRLRGGGLLPFVPSSLEGGRWSGSLPWGGRLELAADQVSSLERMAGPFLDLCWVEPTELTHESGQVLDWRPRWHHSVSGRDLRIAEDRHPWGIGVRAPTTLGWRVSGPGLLTVECGVDDEVAGHRAPAPLRFQVLLDDEVLAEQKGVERGQAPRALRVVVPRAGMLRLRCLSEGDEAASGRHGDWILPRYWLSEGVL